MHPAARAILFQSVNDGKTYLYNAGDELNGFTGGWSVGWTSYSRAYKNPSYLTIDCRNGKAMAYTNNQIDFTNYTRLYIDISTGSTFLSTVSSYIQLASNNNTSGDPITSYAVNNFNSTGPNQNVTLSIDVSDINTSAFVNCSCFSSVTGDTTRAIYNVNKIWLE